MILKEIEITAFRSIDKTLKLKIDHTKFGLIFIEGENRVEPSLGSNGSGKSTLLSSIVWCLFGKTETKLKGDIIHNWNTNRQCSVKILFELDDGLDHTLLRTHKPNKLLLNDEVVSQEHIENLLNIDFDSMLYSVCISQFGAKFFDLIPSIKMNIFTSIMGKELDKWLLYSEEASNKASAFKVKITELRQSVSKYEGILETIDLENLRSKHKNFESERKTIVDGLKSNLSEITVSESKFKEQSRVISGDITKVQQKKIKLNAEIISYNDKIKDANTIILKLNSKFSNAKAMKRNKQAEQEKLKDLLDEDVCPTCGSAVKGMSKHITKEIGMIKTEIVKFEAELDTISEEQVETEKVKNTLDKSLTRLRSDLSSLNEEESTLKSDLTRINVGMDNTTNSINSLKERVAKEEKKKNPFVDMIKEAFKKKELNDRLKRYAEVEIEESESKLITAEYWKKGYKNIRLMVLDESLKELEIHINNNLQSLGMLDWNISVEIESETQKGTLQRELTILVEAPFGGGKVPIEVWSGGEGQRLRLAGTLGLMDFIHDRRGTDWNIEIFDEPSQFLSESGIKDLIDSLFLRAKRLKKTIWFADQKGLDTYGKFMGKIKVIKTEEGTMLEEKSND
jgi:DNA repair exonuclease SbcCD ATPase subunit